jgi:hypothetical protein
MNEIDIVEWFDVNNIEHLKAYYNLQHGGFWDKGFVPEYVTFSNAWQIGLAAKLANAYINLILMRS